MLRSVLLSAAEKSNSKPFSICFVCFPIVLMDFALFFGFVLSFFTPDPAKSQETLKLVGC